MEEATADMASRGLPVKVIEKPKRERIQRGEDSASSMAARENKAFFGGGEATQLQRQTASVQTFITG